MAIAKLKTDYKDDILVSGKREYEMTTNDNGTVSLEDVSTYVQTGDNFGGKDVNATNTAVNELIDKTNNINNTADDQKRVLYAESAGTAESAKSVSDDFVLLNKGALTFNSANICSISDTRITADSLADVYFTSESVLYAEKAVISVETYSGRVELVAGRAPEGTIVASIRIKVVGES